MFNDFSANYTQLLFCSLCSSVTTKKSIWIRSFHRHNRERPDRKNLFTGNRSAASFIGNILQLWSNSVSALQWSTRTSDHQWNVEDRTPDLVLPNDHDLRSKRRIYVSCWLIVLWIILAKYPIFICIPL